MGVAPWELLAHEEIWMQLALTFEQAEQAAVEAIRKQAEIRRKWGMK